ncbi:MAG: glycosyltransferase family 2 protein [Candidatus Aenigmarchaeota archaeon]|nr:glycosyltransferase family 2 protein [Candidatus Aenigmarchaeota archaeon]
MYSVVVPMYNEAKHVRMVLRDLTKRSPPGLKEIIVVNDGSVDNTLELLKKMKQKYKKLRVVNLRRNHGKGYALRVGAKKAKTENIIFIDGDGQHHASEIKRFLKKLRNSDMVIGQRNFSTLPHRRRFTNRLSRIATYMLTGLRFGDILCGFRAVKKRAFLSMNLKEDGYRIEIEMILKAVKKKMKITSVPVSANYERGSRMPFKESLKIAGFFILKVLKG